MFARVPGDETQGMGSKEGVQGILSQWERGIYPTMLPQLLFLGLGDCWGLPGHRDSTRDVQNLVPVWINDLAPWVPVAPAWDFLPLGTALCFL